MKLFASYYLYVSFYKKGHDIEVLCDNVSFIKSLAQDAYKNNIYS